MFCNSCIDSLVSATGLTGLLTSISWHINTKNKRTTVNVRTLAFSFTISVSPRQSQLTEVKGTALGIRSIYAHTETPSFYPGYVYDTYSWAPGNALHEGRTCHGPPPFGKSKVSVLVYHRSSIVFAVRPGQLFRRWLPAIENADNLIDLTITIYGCPRFTGMVGKVNRLLERVYQGPLLACANFIVHIVSIT